MRWTSERILLLYPFCSLFLQKLASLLFQAASDGYANPHKVEDILGVNRTNVDLSALAKPRSNIPVFSLPQLSKEFSRALRLDCPSQTILEGNIKT